MWNPTQMKPIEEYLREVSSKGELDSENGQFTLDPWEAAKSLGEFQVRRFEDCLLKFVQANRAGEAPVKIHVPWWGPIFVSLPMDCGWLTLQSILDFSSNLIQGPCIENRAARHFAFGLASVLATREVRRVDVTLRKILSNTTIVNRVRFDRSQGVLIENAPSNAKPGIQIWRNSRKLGPQKLDIKDLLYRCQYAPWAVRINEEHSHGDTFGRSDFQVDTKRYSCSDFAGLVLLEKKYWAKPLSFVGISTVPRSACGIYESPGLGTSDEFSFKETKLLPAGPRPIYGFPHCERLWAVIHYRHKRDPQSSVTWVDDGVCIETTPLEDRGGHKIIASSALLKKDLLGFGIVKDRSFEQAVRLLLAVIADAPSRISDKTPFIHV